MDNESTPRYSLKDLIIYFLKLGTWGFGGPVALVGYMNVYQQEASGNNYFSTHAIRLFVFHSLDFRHKEEHK